MKCIFKKIYFFLRCKGRRLSIESCQVSIKSLVGSNINIAERTYIDGNCRIGSYTYIGKNCNLTKVDIGRYCSIANNVSIGQGEHQLNDVSTSSFFYQNSYETLTREACTIGNDVWIGSDAVILRGVYIGHGAVVGANAVVTRDVEPFSIVVGSPAKHVRYRLNDQMRSKILISKWWDHDFETAKKEIGRLSDDAKNS